MTDTFAPMPGAANNTQGVAAMSRLADRLAAVAPPAPVLELTRPMQTAQPRFSPAVTAALTTSAAINARAEQRARRSRSIVGLLVHGFVATCSFIPYALVALGLRLVIARVFFFDGQTRIDGPRVPLNVHDFDLSVVLPLQVKAETFAAFLNQYAALPVPPMLAAYLVGYGEFVLPIMLVLGFGTRVAALGLLIMTALIQVYVMPQALWNVHIYWASILMVLLALGPGQISVDAIIRFVTRR